MNKEIKDDNIINHLRNVKLLQAIHSGKKFFVECFPTDEGAICFPNSNRAIKEIELPNFELYEEKKFGYKWVNASSPTPKQPELGEYQVCPKCNGQGIVSRPPYVAGDLNEWVASQVSFECDVCNGKKIIERPTPKQEDEYKIALQWYKQGIEDAGESIGDGIDADFYDQYGEQFKLK